MKVSGHSVEEKKKTMIFVVGLLIASMIIMGVGSFIRLDGTVMKGLKYTVLAVMATASLIAVDVILLN